MRSDRKVDFIKGELKRRTPKKAQLIDMPERAGGADVEALCAAFGWQAHTVRAAISGLRRDGFAVECVAPMPGKVREYKICAAPVMREAEAALSAAVPEPASTESTLVQTPAAPTSGPQDAA